MLYPNKNGCVRDLLEEARKQVALPDNGSGKLRLILSQEYVDATSWFRMRCLMPGNCRVYTSVITFSCVS